MREEGKEFWEGLELFDAVDGVLNDLASGGREEEGIKLFFYSLFIPKSSPPDLENVLTEVKGNMRLLFSSSYLKK